MGEDIYYGRYARFDTASKKDAAVLLGADCLVGDVYEIVFITEEGRRVAWMKNRFGALAGFFGPEDSRSLSLCEARGWDLHAILSFVAFTDSPDPGHYWGEAAIVCFDPAHADAFDPFVQTIARRIGEGMRPEADLGSQGVSQVLDSKGAWSPSQYVPMPGKEAGTALIKTRRSVSEKMIEQARKGNKGCYIGAWAIMLAFVALVLFGLKSCGVF